MSKLVSGRGLYSGTNVSVIFEKGAPLTGVQWFVGKERKSFLSRGLEEAHTLTAPRATLVQVGADCLRMPEHLLAALLGWPSADLSIWVPDHEIPIGDGSSRFWVDAITQVLGSPGEPEFYSCNFSERFDFDFGFWEVEPSESPELVLDLSLSQHGYSRQMRIRVRTLADLQQLWDARTFIFEKDFDAARNAGLLQGADSGCGLVIRVENGTIEPLVGAPLRHADEICLHKALDLIGDLALLRLQLPKLRIRIHNGGHWAHHHLIKRIQSLCQ